MDNIQIQKYINPITFVSEMFVENFINLSQTHNLFDPVLLNTLEKVMSTIETFLDSNPSEILPTNNTKLLACDDLSHIKRIYRCSRCKTDLGISVENVTLHLIKQCSQYGSGDENGAVGGKSDQTSETNSVNRTKNLENHNKIDVRREKKLSRQEQRLDQATKLTKKTRNLLTTGFNQFADNLTISTELKSIPEYDVIEDDLLALITPLYPDKNVKIYKFGSRLAGIGNSESDLDLFIDIGDTFNIFQNRADNETVAKLHTVGRSLVSHPASWNGVVKIDKARVPILKAVHVRTKIECDINFSNSLGIINTKLLDYFFNIQPIARLLCIFMKTWLKRTSLNLEISTYSMNLMVIFYLQTQNVLPSLKKLQENVKQENIGPWLCSYAALTLTDLNLALEDTAQPNLLKFIRELFIFYINYDFNNEVVCPYLGKSIKKFNVETLMPKRYSKFANKSVDHALELDKVVVVQDPIQLNHNVTKRLSAFSLQVTKKYMIKSLNVINSTYLF